MSELFNEALKVATDWLQAASPAKAHELRMKTGAAALSGPINSHNIFSTAFDWPNKAGLASSCDMRANFPDERLADGNGYLEMTLSCRELVADSYFDTKLSIVYGIGAASQLEPISARIGETIDDRLGLVTECPPAPIELRDAVVVLAKFGIGLKVD